MFICSLLYNHLLFTLSSSDQSFSSPFFFMFIFPSVSPTVSSPQPSPLITSHFLPSPPPALSSSSLLHISPFLLSSYFVFSPHSSGHHFNGTWWQWKRENRCFHHSRKCTDGTNDVSDTVWIKYLRKMWNHFYSQHPCFLIFVFISNSVLVSYKHTFGFWVRSLQTF